MVRPKKVTVTSPMSKTRLAKLPLTARLDAPSPVIVRSAVIAGKATPAKVIVLPLRDW